MQLASSLNVQRFSAARLSISDTNVAKVSIMKANIGELGDIVYRSGQGDFPILIHSPALQAIEKDMGNYLGKAAPQEKAKRWLTEARKALIEALTNIDFPKKEIYMKMLHGESHAEAGLTILGSQALLIQGEAIKRPLPDGAATHLKLQAIA